MPERTRWRSLIETACATAFLLWLAWLPLPFGSVIPRARTPLILVPMLLCSLAALARARVPRTSHEPTKPYRIWTAGALALIVVTALQLLPLGAPLLRSVSPESAAIWSQAERLAAQAGIATGTAHPISVDPAATMYELFRLIALFATFQTAVLLVRNHRRRLLLIYVLGAAALFEILYGAREAALGRFTIWGWKNVLVLERATGTFVNPNHFANYVAMAMPLMIFLVALSWHESGPTSTPRGVRMVKLVEQRALRVIFGVVVAAGCVTAVLLAQSRGGLLSLAAGLFAGALIAARRRPVALMVGALASVIVLTGLVLLLGRERTVARFRPLPEEETSTFVGRRSGVEMAVGVWRRFPLFGSGAGTFGSVSPLEQSRDLGKYYRHAHNDYAEIGATTGLLGACLAIPALIGGWFALVQMTFGAAATELRWRRRAFQWAALVSLTICLVHALVDFNFFIPANPATLAAIAGAAVAAYDKDDKRTRR